MNSVFKILKADLLRHPDLCRDLTVIASDVKESTDSFIYLITGNRIFDFVQKLQEISMSYEAFLNSGATPFSNIV